ncbi:MAG: alpha/beta hydrolase [Streptosporangiaceae bacterium]
MSRSRSGASRGRQARLIGAAAAALGVVAVSACSTQAAGSAVAFAHAGTSKASVQVKALAKVQAGAKTPQTVPAGAQTSITWGACPALAPGSTRNLAEKCGTVRVPLNYQDPGGKTITVEVSELATAKPGDFRGYLLLNPGGPALQGLDMPSWMAPTLPASVLDSYDLIGFDPRGVGTSSPISCGLSQSFATVFPYPAADGSITQNVADAKQVAADCAKNVGSDLQYFTTANTARDMDRIRIALGAQKISYWGQSYGTYLGALYATLFPQNTDRMILEGNVNPNAVWQQQIQLWNQGMNQRFPDAAKIAAADNGQLGLGSTVAQVESTFIKLAARLDKTPVPVPGAGVDLSGALLRELTYELLLHNTELVTLTQTWKAAEDLADGTLTAADGAALQQAFNDTNSPGTANVPADNQVSMATALICGDASWSRNIASYAAAVKEGRAAYPLSAGMPDNIWPCAFWPAPAQPPVKVTSHGPRDILLLQNQRDNATPYAGALGMAKALGQRAAFVSVDNGGHYVYDTGSACADQATVAFLTKGTLPARTLYCPGPQS